MTKHADIIGDLYDYCRAELPPDDMRRISEHLESCRACRDEEEELRAILSALPAEEPGSARPAAFWDSFAGHVEARLNKERRPGRLALLAARVGDYFRFGHAARPLVFAGAGGVAAGIAIALFLGRPAPEQLRRADDTTLSTPAITAANTNPDMRDYFRRSKMLLVGISNMKLDGSDPIDVSAERQYSRKLLMEARYIKSRPIDNRSAKLIDDLEKILIELSNLKDEGDAPNIEIIRGGIHQENLLFKIRIAESVFDSTQTGNTHGTF